MVGFSDEVIAAISVVRCLHDSLHPIGWAICSSLELADVGKVMLHLHRSLYDAGNNLALAIGVGCCQQRGVAHESPPSTLSVAALVNTYST
jgi:hypothetical protein